MKKIIIKWALRQLVNLYHREPSYENLYQCGVEDISVDNERKEMSIIVRYR